MLRIPVEVNMISFGPSTKFLQTSSCLVGQLADDGCIEERLDLDRPREVKFLGLRFGCFVPFLQNLRKCRSIYLDELLKLIKIITKLLEAFL